jgi:murein DD-endopeptidase MepM/ murein hydrolase activator NlpD
MNRQLAARTVLAAALAAGPAAGPAAEMAPPRFGGVHGPAADALPHDELAPFERANIELQLRQSAQRLQAQGLLPAPDRARLVDDLAWPLQADPDFRDPDFHGISNYVDLDPAFPNQLLDWNCGQRTYDMASGYNHAGVDYFLWPFGWRMMDSGAIRIVASAPGVIVLKQDGFPDRSCDATSSTQWNAVFVQHADGTVAWYGHMKSGSTTAKAVGESVAVGEYLGLVGSSGRSSGPHLHLELRISNVPGAQVLEAHAGACRTGPSLWAAQRPYRQTGINKLATHSAVPDFDAGCPNPGQETPNFSNHFRPGIDPLYVVAYYRDLVQGAPTTYRLKHRGIVRSQWQHTSAQDRTVAWLYWNYLPLAASTAHGIWVFEAQFGDQRWWHEYTVGTDMLMASGFGG